MARSKNNMYEVDHITKKQALEQFGLGQVRFDQIVTDAIDKGILPKNVIVKAPNNVNYYLKTHIAKLQKAYTEGVFGKPRKKRAKDGSAQNRRVGDEDQLTISVSFPDKEIASILLSTFGGKAGLQQYIKSKMTKEAAPKVQMLKELEAQFEKKKAQALRKIIK